MFTTVVCLPGFERGMFAAGVLKEFQEQNYHIDRIIAGSTSVFPAVFFAADKIENHIEEFIDFDMRKMVRLESVWKRIFAPHATPGVFKNNGFRKEITERLNKHHVFEQLTKHMKCEVEIFATNLQDGSRGAFKISSLRHEPHEYLVNVFLASLAVVPIWPAVFIGGTQYGDATFAPNYFLASALTSEPGDKFVICLGDPLGTQPKLKKYLQSWVSTNFRVTDILCGNKIHTELILLRELPIRTYVLADREPLLRVSPFKKTPEDVKSVIKKGRWAALQYLGKSNSIVL